MSENIMLPKPVIYMLEIACNWAVHNLLIHPYQLSGADLGNFYNMLSYHADLIEKKQQRGNSENDLESLVKYTKAVLHTDEVQAGWHVLSRFMDERSAKNMADKKLARMYVLDNYEEFKHKLYSNRIWFVAFIERREDCIIRLGETKIINPEDYLS